MSVMIPLHASPARPAMSLLSATPAPADSTNPPPVHHWSALPATKITPDVSSAAIPHNAHPAPSDMLYPLAISVQLNILELIALSARLAISRRAATATHAALPLLPTAVPATSVQPAPNATPAMSSRQTARAAKQDSTTLPQLPTIPSTAPHAPRSVSAAQNATIPSTAPPAPSASQAQHAKSVPMDTRELIVQFATQD